jgi:serine/threonine protein kinase
MKKFKELTKSEKLNRIKDILAKKKFELCEGSENSLGEGGFGAVFKVQEKERKNHIYAAKMIFDDVKDKEEKVKEFRGKNIIKILYHYMDKEEDFYMIVMELSSIGDLEKLIGTQNKKGFLTKEKEKRIFEEPFEEKFGDNLTRFFAKQLINAIKNFYMGKLVHFDIKPANALLFKNLELKLIDFSLVQKIDSKYEKEKGTIPGGTRGFVTPEYYNPSGIPMDFTKLQSQDFFAIGATIFYLKYGERMLDYLPYVEDLDKE